MLLGIKREQLVIKTVNNHHICIRDICKNRQLKSSWAKNYYLLRFKENPHWPAKDILNAMKVDFGTILDK